MRIKETFLPLECSAASELQILKKLALKKIAKNGNRFTQMEKHQGCKSNLNNSSSNNRCNICRFVRSSMFNLRIYKITNNSQNLFI